MNVTISYCMPPVRRPARMLEALRVAQRSPSADHILRELLRAPHLAAHEGRKTAADDRAHRDEGGATLHEPRMLSTERNDSNWSVPS